MLKYLFFICLGLNLFCAHTVHAQNFELDSAKNAYYVGDLGKAKHYIDLAYRNKGYANNADMHLYRGLVYFYLGYNEKTRHKIPEATLIAFEAFMECQSLDTSSARQEQVLNFLVNLAFTCHDYAVDLYQQKKYELSWKNFETVLKIIPLDVHGILYKNQLYPDKERLYAAYAAQQAGFYTVAIGHYRYFMDKEIQDPQFYLSAASLFFMYKDTLGSLEAVEKGRILFPQDKALRQQEVNIYLVLNDKNKKLSKLNEIILSDKNVPKWYMLRAQLYLDEKQEDKAEADYLTVIGLNTDSVKEASYALGVIYYEHALPIEKIKNATNPRDAYKYRPLKQKTEDLFFKSVRMFEKSLEYGEDEDALLYLYDIYERMGYTFQKEGIKERLRKLP